jgi:UDP-N-acetylglucosamine 2-epimerase
VRVLTVVGNRPAVRQGGAVSRPLRRRADEILVHTGQHYDDALSRVFFDELDVPRPIASSGSAAARTPTRPRACSPRSSR